MQQVPVAKASDVSFNEGVLRLAAIHQRAVEFRYSKTPASPIETRSFVPQAVAVTNDNNVVVIGEDEDRDAPRAFRLDRIKGDVRVP